MMKFVLVILVFKCFHQGEMVCPLGTIEGGVSSNTTRVILNAHNMVRKMILEGKFPNQPKAASLPPLSWDEKLATEAQIIANTCEFEHVRVNDTRFSVGQNLYIFYSSGRSLGANWQSAVNSWVKENRLYKYPNHNPRALHYTQVVWADTRLVGCGYVMFEIKNGFRYRKLYVCNYGPAGNVAGRPPYKLE